MCEEEEVLDLDVQSLGALLGSDDLNVSQEERVLELVLRWVERRRGNSQSEAQAVELLRRVRLELVEPGFLRRARRRNPVGGRGSGGGRGRGRGGGGRASGRGGVSSGVVGGSREDT